mmetsp:Transcript_39509/g.92922  ORF Transcript_39509/g.92922 Transcript_39509/m.92922 type:complete len:523 (-) Transcript_39509:42-1610(-)
MQAMVTDAICPSELPRNYHPANDPSESQFGHVPAESSHLPGLRRSLEENPTMVCAIKQEGDGPFDSDVPPDSAHLPGLHKNQELRFREGTGKKSGRKRVASKPSAAGGPGKPARGANEPPPQCPGAPPRIGRIAAQYVLGRKLGCGSFGEVYHAVNAYTGEEYAAKLEKVDTFHPQLLYEGRLLQNFQGVTGISHMHFCDVHKGYYCLLMDYLGPSLENLFNRCGRKFSLKTVLMIAEQLLTRIEYLHSKNFVHRDIKPENFVIGRGSEIGTIYMIDFGLAKRYKGPRELPHIPYREGRSLTGTARYASINSHKGAELSRRDDLEAIGYLLIYFLTGSLPWQGIKDESKEDRYRKIMECKMALKPEDLCKGLPVMFVSYLYYCKSLRFEDKPDYAYLRRLCKDLVVRSQFPNDGKFDWMVPAADRVDVGKKPTTTSTTAASKARQRRLGEQIYGGFDLDEGESAFFDDGSSSRPNVLEDQVDMTIPPQPRVVGRRKRLAFNGTLTTALSKLFGCGTANLPRT